MELITYFMFWRKASAPELGTYHTYDIAAYGDLWRDPLAVVRDAALDGELVLRMVQPVPPLTAAPEGRSSGHARIVCAGRAGVCGSRPAFILAHNRY